LKSQSWDDFEHEHPDIVITVCDSAANESCPVWLGNTLKVHWSLPDPSKLEGSDEAIRAAFFSVMNTIEQRVIKLLDLNFESLSKEERQEALNGLVGE
jgi:arsenate reductase